MKNEIIGHKVRDTDVVKRDGIGGIDRDRRAISRHPKAR